MSGIVQQSTRPFAAGSSRVVEDATRSIDGAGSTDELYRFIETFCRQIGFDYFSYFMADPLQSAADPMGATSYPQSWRARYLRQGYQHHDPVLAAGGAMRRPFVWGDRDYVGRLTGTSRRMFDEARAFGICGGLSIPVHGPGGDSGLLSVSCRHTGAALADAVRESLPVLHIVAHHIHAAMVERLLPPPGRCAVQLTEQESACLAWTLRGKTAWEIAQIIGRSRATVNFHLQKSLRKLGCSSKHQAAMKARQVGLL